MDALEKLEFLIGELGVEDVLENIVKWMPNDDLADACDYIARMWDVDLEEGWN